MADGALAAMVHHLADDKVQLQVGDGLAGLAADEPTGLGEIGGEHAGAMRAPVKDALDHAHDTCERQTEQVGELGRHHHLRHVSMVMQVLPNAWQVVHNRYAVALQLRGVTDARQH